MEKKVNHHKTNDTDIEALQRELQEEKNVICELVLILTTFENA